MSEVGQKNQPKKNRPFFTTLYLYYFVKKRLSPWRIIPLPHNDIITQIQTLVQDTRHISLILSLFIKWTVVQNVNMMSEHNMSLCHNATFLFMYQIESCSNLTTWQLYNLTTWQHLDCFPAFVCLSDIFVPWMLIPIHNTMIITMITVIITLMFTVIITLMITVIITLMITVMITVKLAP